MDPTPRAPSAVALLDQDEVGRSDFNLRKKFRAIGALDNYAVSASFYIERSIMKIGGKNPFDPEHPRPIASCDGRQGGTE
jgi:hypothetical protein